MIHLSNYIISIYLNIQKLLHELNNWYEVNLRNLSVLKSQKYEADQHKFCMKSRVTSINLSNRCLTTFNTELLNQMFHICLNEFHTQEINFSNNILMTTDGFSRYLNLENLNLSHNKINVFFQLPSKILVLDLSHNKLGRVFEEFALSLKSKGTRQETKTMFANLIHLRDLNLSHNEIKIVTSSVFEQNKDLQNIDISNNQLRGIIWSFKLLQKLQRVDLSHNKIEYYSDLRGLDKIPSLQSLTISGNPLENVFQNLEDVTKKIRGTLPMISHIHTHYGVIEKSINMCTELSQTNTPRKALQSSYSQQQLSQMKCIEGLIQSQKGEDSDLFDQLPSLRRSRQKQDSKLSSEGSKTMKLKDKPVTPFNIDVCAQQSGKQQIDRSPPPQKNKTPVKLRPKLDSKQTQAKILSNKPSCQFKSTRSTEGCQVKQVSHTIPVKQFTIDPNRNILQVQDLLIEQHYATPQRLRSTSTLLGRTTIDDEQDTNAYKEVLENIQSLNIGLKLKKQSLSHSERENNQQKFGHQLLKEILKQTHLMEDSPDLTEFTRIMDQLQEQLMSGNLLTLSKRQDYLLEVKLSLLQLKKNNGSLTEVIQKIKQTEQRLI